MAEKKEIECGTDYTSFFQTIDTEQKANEKTGFLGTVKVVVRGTHHKSRLENYYYGQKSSHNPGNDSSARGSYKGTEDVNYEGSHNKTDKYDHYSSLYGNYDNGKRLTR